MSPTEYRDSWKRKGLNVMAVDSKRRRSHDAKFSKGADLAARPRSPIKNNSDPRGQLGLFLRAWFEANPSRTELEMGKALGVSDRAVRKWCEGASSPSVRDLDKLAKFVGLTNWAQLAAESVAAAKRRRR